jgi:hypothetical protein
MAQESGDSSPQIVLIEPGQEIAPPKVRCVLQTYLYWEKGENYRRALMQELEAKTKVSDFYEANVGRLLEIQEKQRPGFIGEHSFEIGVIVGVLTSALIYHSAR